MIYNPLEEFDKTLKNVHLEKTKAYFDELVRKSGVNAEENRATVKEHDALKNALSKLKKKYHLWRFLRVLACITLVLIPLVVIKITPKIKALKEEIAQADKKMDDLFDLAQRQMAPLNNAFTERDALNLIESTIPQLSFSPCFSVEQEANMTINYDFDARAGAQQSTLDVLAGQYNENPFVFESKLTCTMGVQIYHGYKTISWTETYVDSDGKRQTRVRTQTLHASVTKPKPFYSTQVLLQYCCQGGPDLAFTRDATNLDEKSDAAIERYVKRGAKKLKRKTDKSVKDNKDFVSMSNTDFEVLFDALDRTDEVQFRTLFTPLAQTNMVDLIRSKTGYGDDFHFIKRKRTNTIRSEHSQNRPITLSPAAYCSYSFDSIQESFISKNAEYFKAVYFDFAPLWAIPLYQEKPVQSLQPIPDYPQKYSCKECEALSNRIGAEHVVHPLSKTQAILKSSFVQTRNDVDEICISAYSYDAVPRVAIIPVLGGDGHMHNVAVPWDEYVPLQENKHFFVGASALAENRHVLAKRNDLCIFE